MHMHAALLPAQDAEEPQHRHALDAAIQEGGVAAGSWWGCAGFVCGKGGVWQGREKAGTGFAKGSPGAGHSAA